MFLGTFTPKLLTNGQLALPAKIRSQLPDSQIILTTGFDRCVYGFSQAEWSKLADTELARPLSTDEGRQIRRRVFAAAEIADLDSQGRFVIPEFLKKYAGITGDLVVVGAGDHFEIWSGEEWARMVGAL